MDGCLPTAGGDTDGCLLMAGGGTDGCLLIVGGDTDGCLLVAGGDTDGCLLIAAAGGACRWVVVPRLCLPRLLNELVSPLGPKITPDGLVGVVSLPLVSGGRAFPPVLMRPG